MKGRVKENELSEQKYFRTLAMCHEYEILQTIFLETFHTFFPDQGVEHFYWHEQETVQGALSVTFVLEMHEFIIQIERRGEARRGCKWSLNRQLLAHN